MVQIHHSSWNWNDTTTYVEIWLFPDPQVYRATDCKVEYLLDVRGVFDYLNYQYNTSNQEILNYDLYYTFIGSPTVFKEVNLTYSIPAGRSGWLIDLSNRGV